jgi:hypothetical protein
MARHAARGGQIPKKTSGGVAPIHLRKCATATEPLNRNVSLDFSAIDGLTITLPLYAVNRGTPPLAKKGTRLKLIENNELREVGSLSRCPLREQSQHCRTSLRIADFPSFHMSVAQRVFSSRASNLRCPAAFDFVTGLR